MSFDTNKYNFSSLNGVNVNNYSDYDLDYIRMQIKKNSESLERSLENLRRIASRRDSEMQKAGNN
ncbi:MAG: hypothetical protein ACM3KR_10885 [Deltaproteobacteria bacterium]